MKPLSTTERGQAIAEMTAGLIVFTVLFLFIILLGDICRARMKVGLQAREQVGLPALQGMQVGSAEYYGSGFEALQSEILEPVEHPISSSIYEGGSYPYIQKNLVAPFYGGGSTLVSHFNLGVSEVSEDVQNIEFLVRYNVGPDVITVSEKASMPVMQEFD